VKEDEMERKGFIGGSDAPIILGLSPWKSPYQLWLEKIGQDKDQSSRREQFPRDASTT